MGYVVARGIGCEGSGPGAYGERWLPIVVEGWYLIKEGTVRSAEVDFLLPEKRLTTRLYTPNFLSVASTDLTSRISLL